MSAHTSSTRAKAYRLIDDGYQPTLKMWVLYPAGYQTISANYLISAFYIPFLFSG